MSSPPNMMSDFRQLAQNPSISSAAVTTRKHDLGTITDIQVKFSTKSYVTWKQNTTAQTISVLHGDTSDQILSLSAKSPLSSEILYSATSPSGKFKVVFRETTAGNSDKKKTVAEVYDEHLNVLGEIEIGDKHGKIFNDDFYGPPSFDPNDRFLVYIAEATSPRKRNKNDYADPDDFNYIPDLGERYTGLRRPQVFLLSLDNKPSIAQVTTETHTSHFYFGQPVSVSEPNGPISLYCTAYHDLGDGRRLGQIYCGNRPTTIKRLDVKLSKESEGEPTTTVHDVSNADRSYRSARVFYNDEGKPEYAVCLSMQTGRSHLSSSSLHGWKISQDSITKIEALYGAQAFGGTLEQTTDKQYPETTPALYVDQLPMQCFLRENGNLYVTGNAQYRSHKLPFTFDIATRALNLHSSFSNIASTTADTPLTCSVFGTDRSSTLVGVCSGLATLPQLLFGRFIDGKIRWTSVYQVNLPAPEIAQKVQNLHTAVIDIPQERRKRYLEGTSEAQSRSDDPGPTEVLIISPSKPGKAKKASLLICPHGGPNGSFPCAYSPTNVSYALAGYTVALVNYPGSLAFGDKWIRHLEKNLGKADVLSVKIAKDYLLEQGYGDPSKIFYTGGSHGGFIGTSLTSRFPSEWHGAAIRNPVTDMVGDLSVTDIPDWVYGQNNTPYSFEKPPFAMSREEYEASWKVSPTRYLREHIESQSSEKICPTLVLIGAKDRRVPAFQSRAWYHGLRQAGAKTKALEFENDWHALDSVEGEYMAFQATLEWFAAAMLA